MTDDLKREILGSELRLAGVPEDAIPDMVKARMPTAGWTTTPGETSSPRLPIPGVGYGTVAEAIAAETAAETAAAEAAKPKPPTNEEKTAAYQAARREARTAPAAPAAPAKPRHEMSTEEYVQARRAARCKS